MQRGPLRRARCLAGGGESKTVQMEHEKKMEHERATLSLGYRWLEFVHMLPVLRKPEYALNASRMDALGRNSLRAILQLPSAALARDKPAAALVRMNGARRTGGAAADRQREIAQYVR